MSPIPLVFEITGNEPLRVTSCAKHLARESKCTAQRRPGSEQAREVLCQNERREAAREPVAKRDERLRIAARWADGLHVERRRSATGHCNHFARGDRGQEGHTEKHTEGNETARRKPENQPAQLSSQLHMRSTPELSRPAKRIRLE